MVKILSFRVLDPEKQRVVAPPEEPLYFLACEEFYILYTKTGKIQILSYSDSEAVVLTEFRPKSKVIHIKYLPKTDSIVTIESEDDTSAIMVCRIYSHWRPKSSESMSVTALDVPRSVRAVAACPISATVAVATDESITLFDVSRPSRKAVWMCEIGAAQVKFLALRGDLLAYATSIEVLALSYNIERSNIDAGRSDSALGQKSLKGLCRQVLQQRHVDAEKSRQDASFALKYLPAALGNRILGGNGTSNSSAESRRSAGVIGGSDSASKTSIGTNNVATFVFQAADGKPPRNSVPTMNLPVKQLLDHSADGPAEVLQPSQDPHVVETNGEDGFSVIQSTLLLYRRLDASDAEETPAVHSLALVADDCLFFASSRCGYLYSIQQQSGGERKSVSLAKYLFTDDTLSAVASDTLIVAATADGVHCFVRRSQWSPHHLRLNPTSGGAGGNSASSGSSSSSLDPDPCVVCIQPFMSITGMDVHHDQVILLSKITSTEMMKKLEHAMQQQQPRGRKGSAASASGAKKSSSAAADTSAVGWTLYQVRPTEPLGIYDQMRTMAMSYKESHPQVYYMLLVEIHHFLSCWLSSAERAKAANQAVDTETIQRCQVLLRSSYSSLGEYFYSEKDYQRAAESWSRSDAPINSVLYRLFQILPSSLAAQKYVKNYLKRVLFDSTMKPLWKKDQDLGNRIFQLLHKNAPHLLGRIILESYLSGYSKSVVQPIMETAEMFLADRVPDDLESGWVIVDRSSRRRAAKYGAKTREEQRLWEVNLALCSLYATHGPAGRAVETLKKIPERVLVNYLISHPEIVRKHAAKADTSRPRRPRARSRSMPEHEIRDFVAESSGEASEAGMESSVHQAKTLEDPKEADVAIDSAVSNSSLSEFGTFLMQQQPWTMFEVLLRGFLAGEYSLDTALRFLEVSPERRLLVVTFLEVIVLNLGDSNMNEPNIYEEIRARLLATILELSFASEIEQSETLRHLCSDSSDSSSQSRSQQGSRSSSSKPFGSLPGSSGDHGRLNFEIAWKEFHRHAFVEAYSKLKWIERIPPFCDLSTGKSVPDPALSNLKGGIIPSFFYLRKLVGLTASALTDCKHVLGQDFVRHVSAELKSREDSAPTAKALARSLAIVEDLESNRGLNSVFDMFKNLSISSPTVYLGFVSSLCKSHPALWADALTYALDAEKSPQKTEKHTEMLKSVLEQSAIALKPTEFLTLLPDDGDAAFFLPYIELCLSQSSARQLLNNMKTSVQADLDNPNSGLSNFSTSVLYGPWKTA